MPPKKARRGPGGEKEPVEHVFPSRGAGARYPAGEGRLTIGEGRPRTWIGPQGDHVTAYALIKHSILAAMQGCPVEDALGRLFKLIAAISSQLEEGPELIEGTRKRAAAAAAATEAPTQIDRIKLKLDDVAGKLIQLQDYNIVRTALAEEECSQRVLSALLHSNFRHIEDLASEVADIYLELRNKKIWATFPREGAPVPPGNEGVRVKQALVDLRRLHDGLQPGDVPPGDIIDRIANAMFHLFWYPKVEQVWDINSREWLAVNHKYNQGAVPRNNDLGILYEVVTSHIDLVFLCFNEFLDSRYRSKLTEKFVSLVANQGGLEGVPCHWAMTESESQQFLAEVNKRLDVFGYGDYDTGASASGTPSAEDEEESDSDDADHGRPSPSP